MEQTQELWQKWDDRARRLHPRMEISGEGLSLGPGTVLAGMGQDERGRPRLALDDEPRVMALLATAYERPVDVRLLTKLRRAAELWNDGEKALAHIHLSYARLPPCEEVQALRLFVADELIEAGVTPETLMKAQGFDPAPLTLLKFNPNQPRVPAGSGRESGEWSGGANIDTAGVKEFIARLALEAAQVKGSRRPAGMAQDERGRPRLAFDDEPRALALLATAYERPGDVQLLAKLRRAAELWNDGEKALAHIHLAHARLPPCSEEQALRLFVADELIAAGVTPAVLMKAQGFDFAPLALLKAHFNPVNHASLPVLS